jgi:polyphenol oxidase
VTVRLASERRVRVGPGLPVKVTQVAERAGDGGVYCAPVWRSELPWLTHGMTGRDHDMTLFGRAPVGSVLSRWTALRDALGFTTVVHARQVHGADILIHAAMASGLHVAPDADGHVTAQPDLLLAVSVADCVPIYIAAPERRAIALLHGGWRGVAAGILEAGVAALQRMGAAPDSLYLHLGPAICGDCYEVGAEVPAALGLADAAAISHVDVRAALVHRALACGVSVGRTSVSTWCTRHGDTPFFSHRGGCPERQIAVLGIRAPAG